MKPFSTYPEDREKLMSLARVLQAPHDVETGEKAADDLSDLVLAILSDEATDTFDAELDAADLMKIDEAWEKHKAAGPLGLLETANGLKRIVEEIDGTMNHGTWRDENGLRLKDTPEWVSFYNAITDASKAEGK